MNDKIFRLAGDVPDSRRKCAAATAICGRGGAFLSYALSKSKSLRRRGTSTPHRCCGTVGRSKTIERFVDVVSDENSRSAVEGAYFAERLHHVRPEPEVERRKGLVHEDGAALIEERPCDGHALRLTARERRRVAERPVGEPDAFEHGGYALLFAADEAEIARYRQVGHEPGALKDV